MAITVGGWIGLLVGLAIGGIGGLICGAVMTDNYWKKKIRDIYDKIDKYMEEAPYKIEKE